MRDVVVVGAGVAGLTAARDLVRAGRDVLVLEGSPDVGGKLRRASVAGVTVDVGAEAMLDRRPEGVALAAELGLEVVHPTSAASQVWSRGALRRLPRSLMGVPFDLDDLASSGVLSPAGLARAGVERVGAAADPTTSRSATWSPRGSATRSSTGWSSRCSAACTPAARGCSPRPPRCRSCSPWPGAGSLLEQAAAMPRLGRARSSPASPAGWAGSPRSLAARARGPHVGATVRASCVRAADGWRAHRRLGRARRRRSWRRAVVLATPAAPTARLLDGVAPGAARDLAPDRVRPAWRS